MIGLVRKLHNRRPLLWTVLAFIVVVVTATILSVWWNVLLVQNHRILEQMTRAATAAANDPLKANVPLALLMVLGILCSLVIVLGLVYLFLRLIRAVQLNLAQSQFIAAVTHELKSPVAALQIMLDTIRDESTPAAKRQEFEEHMSVELRRLRALVEQVLETARLENLISGPTNENIRVGDLIHECRDTVYSRLKTTNSSLIVGPYSGDLFVRGNRRLLTSAMVNLLDNAIKYSPGPADIHLDVITGLKSIVIEVRDKGVGITRREQKRIFRRFYRAADAASQAKPGTGLGLYFARLAIKAQGGKISVRSPGAGMGTTFRVELTRVSSPQPGVKS